MKSRFVFGTVIVAIIIIAWATELHNYFSLEMLKANSERLQLFVTMHYYQAVLAFILIYIAATLMFLPFVMLLTVTGGYLFGSFWGACYSDIGATIGSTGAFLLVRYCFGSLLNYRYQTLLAQFNKELEYGQIQYLLAIHFIAIIPFPIINTVLALTTVSLSTFVWTTAIGILPGALIYAFAGRQLTTIHSLQDIFSFKVAMTCCVLALLVMLPIIIKRFIRKTVI